MYSLFKCGKIVDKLIVQYWFKNDDSEVDTDARKTHGWN